jgi:hypothetical protein
MSIIPALGILSQEDIEFKVGLGYIVRTCQRKRRRRKRNRRRRRRKRLSKFVSSKG